MVASARLCLAFAASLAVLATTAPPCACAELDASQRPALSSAQPHKAALLAVTRAGERLVAAGERGIVVLSDDHGITWRQARVPVSVSLTHVRFVTPHSGWAVGHAGVVLRTVDGGESWDKQLDHSQIERLAPMEAPASPGPAVDRPLFDAYFADEQHGFVAGAHGLLLATEDGGTTWSRADERLPNLNGRHLYAIVAAGAALHIAGERGLLYRSTDGGRHFTEIETPYRGSYFGVVPLPAGIIVHGLRGHAYWSADAVKHWRSIDIDAAVTVGAACVLADRSVLLVNQAGRVWHGTDGTQRFMPLSLLRHPAPVTGVVQGSDGSVVFSTLRGVIRVVPGENATTP